MMKKAALMMATMLVAFTMTSCDDDNYIARTLEGTWKGDMYVSTYWNSRYYYASYTEVCFLRDPYTYSSGTGYWVDYYDNNYWGNYDYVASHIEWTVNNGNIRIYFVEDGVSVVIYNYALDNDYFTGYIDLDNGERQKFSLYHVSSPNWNNYYWNGYDYYYDDYYYSNENCVGLEGESTNEKAVGEKPKRVFRSHD